MIANKYFSDGLNEHGAYTVMGNDDGSGPFVVMRGDHLVGETTTLAEALAVAKADLQMQLAHDESILTKVKPINFSAREDR